MFKKLFYLFAVSPLFLFSSCSDDNDPTPEDADENFITSVTFSVGETTYSAKIEENTITITVPYTVSLNNAEAGFIYTPSAKIMPDPATIKDWDNERTFRVTSYNGDVNEYTYKVIKDEIRHEGNAELKTAAEVAAFVASDVTVVRGDLIIGSDEENAEPLNDISSLILLKEVEGKVIMRNSYAGAELTGLDNITSIGGLQIGTEENYSKASKLQAITMKGLQKITGDMVVMNNTISIVTFESLTSIEGSLKLNSSTLKTFDFPKLTDVSNDIMLKGINEKEEDAGEISVLTIPALTTVGGALSVNHFTNLISMSFPKLQTAGSIDFTTISVQLETLALPELTTVNGDINFTSNIIRGEFASDTEYNERLNKIDGLNKLTTVKGTFTIAYFNQLAELPDFNKISTMGGLELNWLQASNGKEIDLSNINFETFNGKTPIIKIYRTQFSKIITKEDLSHIDVDFYLTVHPELTFKMVRNFTYNSTAQQNPTFIVERVLGNFSITTGTRRKIEAPGLKSVDGYLRITSPMSMSLSFPELEAVGGQLYVVNIMGTHDFSKLKQVCCAADPAYALEGINNDKTPIGSLDIAANNKDLLFPELERIGGTGLTLGGIKSISCPKLTTIDGALSIHGIARSITKVGFKTLTKLTGLYFNGATNFRDFTEFGKFVQDGSITEANWRVERCGYNPTYQNMKDGQYTMP